jgi:hypothetical protein
VAKVGSDPYDPRTMKYNTKEHLKSNTRTMKHKILTNERKQIKKNKENNKKIPDGVTGLFSLT